MMVQISSRDFNQDVGAAKRASLKQPVVITERGTPSHVLLSIEDYHRLLRQQPSLAEMLSCDDVADLNFDKSHFQSKDVDFD